MKFNPEEFDDNNLGIAYDVDFLYNNPYTRGLYEQLGGAADYVGYKTGAKQFNDYGDTLYKMSAADKNDGLFSTMLNYLGRQTHPIVAGLAASKAMEASGLGVLSLPALFASSFAANVSDATSEIGTLYRNLKNKGYSDQDIQTMIDDSELDEWKTVAASFVPTALVPAYLRRTAPKVGEWIGRGRRRHIATNMDVTKNKAAAEIYQQSGLAATEGTQNIIYDKLDNKYK